MARGRKTSLTIRLTLGQHRTLLGGTQKAGVCQDISNVNNSSS
jgi:hypothetical protein